MRCMLALAVCLAAGCADFEDALNTERQPTTPPGILPADQAGGIEEAAGTNEAAPAAPPAQGEPAPATPDQKPGIIGKMTAKVVDKQKAMSENPKLIVKESTPEGQDPLSYAASAYISLRSKASTFGFQSELKNFKVLNERNPTYEEFTDMMKRNRIEFAELPPFQMYGYDSQTGEIAVLEDPEEKARRYKEAGIELNE